MTNIPKEDAPSKRAVEIVERMLGDVFGTTFYNHAGAVATARTLDAELRKEREAERERCVRAIEQFAAASYPLYKDDLLREATAAIRAGAPPAPDCAESGEDMAKAVKPIIEFVEFLLDRETCTQDYPTDKCREVIAALAAYRGSKP